MIGNRFILFGADVREMAIKSGFESVFSFTDILDTAKCAHDKINKMGCVAVGVLDDLKFLASGATMESIGD